MAVALLDVNVLVALFFPDHVHHDIAHDWFEDQRPSGWATCPVTISGFLRVASQQPTEHGLIRPAEALGHLAKLCADRQHQFWPDSVSLLDAQIFDAAYITSHRHVTDVALLGLAHSNGGVLATFDRHIPHRAVRGASAASLAVLAPVPSDD